VARAEVRGYTHHLTLATGALTSRLALDVAPPGGDCVALPSALLPQGARWGGAAAREWALDAGTLTVCGATPAPAGPLALEVDVQLGAEAGLAQRRDRQGRPFTSLRSWFTRCTQLGPCDPGWQARPSLLLEVAHAPGETVLCGGAREVAGPTLTRCRMEDLPLYSALGLVASTALPAEPQLLAEAAGTRLLLHAAPGAPVASALPADVLAPALARLVGLLGPLPTGPDLRVVAAPEEVLGFEHPGNILLREDLPLVERTGYAQPALHSLMHELVHHWAGNRATPAGPLEVGWKEAVSEYLAAVLLEELRPAEEADVTRLTWDRMGRFAPYHPRPLDVPAPPPEVLNTLGYDQGPLALFVQLEPLVGRPAVLAGLARFLAPPSGPRTFADLRAALEAEAGVSLATYWAAWVEGAGEPRRPTFEVEQVGEGRVRVRQVQPGAPLPCAVEVELQGATGSVRVLARFDLQAPPASVDVAHALGEPVTGVRIDPGHRVLDIPFLP
jgi:aminopeptidase N